MLDKVAAVRFDGEVESGKTCPCLLGCESENGDIIELVAKFSSKCERGVGALVAEAIGAMVAADLELPVPEPFLVELEPEFIAAVQTENSSAAELMADSSKIAFGSKKLPSGFTTLPQNQAISPKLQAQAAEILTFDLLIQNSDRRPDNPNCLSNGSNYAIFDHEFAFFTEGVIGWLPPWEDGGLDNGPDHHVFYSGLRRSDPLPNLDRIKDAWTTISSERLDEYRAVLPVEWVENNGVADACIEYLTKLIENIDSAIAGVVRVLV